MLTSKNDKLHDKSTFNLLKQERRWWRQKGRRERSEDRSKREGGGGRRARGREVKTRVPQTAGLGQQAENVRLG